MLYCTDPGETGFPGQVWPYLCLVFFQKDISHPIVHTDCKKKQAPIKARMRVEPGLADLGQAEISPLTCGENETNIKVRAAGAPSAAALCQKSSWFLSQVNRSLS